MNANGTLPRTWSWTVRETQIPPGSAMLLEPGGDVHAVAVEVAVGSTDHVAQVDADPEADALRLGHRRLALGHAALDAGRALDRVDGAGELAERAVAHELDETAPVLGQERVDELAAVGLEAREGGALVGLHQARVADHVRRQDGGEPPLDPCRRHRHPPARTDSRTLGSRARRGGAAQPACLSIDANA